MAEEKCSFCGAEKDEVDFLFDSENENGAFICDECVMNCVNIMVYGPNAVMEIEIDCDDLELEEKDAEAQANSGC